MPARSNDQSQPTDAIAMLKDDHRKVRDLFQQYDAARDPSAKRERAQEVTGALEIHAQLEEQLFYPAVADQSDEGEELAQESVHEHQQVKRLMQELWELGPDAMEFNSKFQELRRNVEYHMNEEESKMFPLAEVQLEEDMEELTEEMQELKKELIASE
jgi:hemerythrin superfamily protein